MNPVMPAHEGPTTAILFADWSRETDHALGSNHALLPLLGKPMLQRAMDQLVRLGCERVVVVLGEDSPLFRNFLGSGARWGCEVSYQYLRPGETLSQLLHWLDPQVSSHCWLADVQTLPAADQLGACGSMRPDDWGSTLCWADMKEQHWSGWGLFSSLWLRQLPIPIRREALARCILSTARIERRNSCEPLQVIDATTFLSCNMQLLNRSEACQITIGRHCSIDASAKLVAPVHLGEHVRVEPGCVIGPHVVIGDNSLIDRDAQMQSCVVLPNTYVGEGLELNFAVVNGRRLANTAIGTVMEVDDRNILCALSSTERARWQDKWAARALRLALAPLYWTCELRCADLPPTAGRSYVPSPEDGPRPWACHFHRSFYPALTEVAQGRLHMVGPMPRSTEELQVLPQDWRRLYGSTRPGLLSEALVRPSQELSTDELFASDAMASISQDQGAVLPRLLGRYLGRVLADVLAPHVNRLVQDAEKPDSSPIHHRPV